MMKNQNRHVRSRRNYYVDIASLLPFLVLLITGLIMLGYHAGKPLSDTTLGRNGDFWLNTHIVFAVLALVMVSVHLSLHLNWFKKLFSSNRRNKYWLRNLLLFVLFLTTTVTSVLPWLVIRDPVGSGMFLGIHNKLGLILIVFFAIHLITYFKWLYNMTIKEFNKNKSSRKMNVVNKGQRS